MDSMPSLAILKINFHFKKWGYITQHLSTRFVHAGRKAAQPKLRNQKRLGISVFPPALPLTRLYSAVQTPHIPQLFPLTCHSTQCMYTVRPRNLHSIVLYLSTESYIKNNTILRHFKYRQCFASLCSQQITKIAGLFPAIMLWSQNYHPSQYQQDWTQGFLVGHDDTPDIFWHFCPLT